MSQLQNWSHVVKNIQNANLDKHTIEMRIKGLNKRAYRQQLDRQVKIKNHAISLQNAQKRRELQQAKYLAQAEQIAKLQSRQANKQLARHYGEQNEQIIRQNKEIKSHSKQIQRKNIKNFLQHPFVQLVQGQDSRMQHLRHKFIKQNQINHLQQQMHKQQKQANRYKQIQEKNQFMDYIELTHKKRSADRQMFKNKYLRIKKPQLDSTLNHNIKEQQSVQKMYTSYLNNQIKSNNQKRLKEKSQRFDDKRIEQFYSRGHIVPDSSPAFLGRNPLSHERRRQLYFINKHLNTHHQRSLTSNCQLNSKTDSISNMIAHRSQIKSNQHIKLPLQLNPEQNYINQSTNRFHPLIKSKNHQNHTQNQHSTQKHMMTQNHISQREHSYNQRPQIYYTGKNNQKQALDKSRRIKSELFQQSYQSPQKLPNLSSKLMEPHRQINNHDKLHKKQYFRYDVITGKQVQFGM